MDKRPTVSSLNHHALPVLVIFNTVMPQPVINCCSAIGPVWCSVGCWHNFFFGAVSRDTVESWPEGFASEWMFQAVQIAVNAGTS